MSGMADDLWYCKYCTNTADPNQPRTCYGWQVIPFKVCPSCIDKELARREKQKTDDREKKPGGDETGLAMIIEKSTFMGKVIHTMEIQ